MKKIAVSAVFVLAAITVFSINSGVNAANTSPFSTNVSYGMRSNADVTALQEFLTTEGYYSGPVTGNFLNLTFKAVKAFQTQNGITPVSGYFGPLSRAKANTIVAGEVATYNAQVSSTTASTAPTVAPAAPVPSTVQTTLNIITLLEARIGSMFQKFWDRLSGHSNGGGSSSGGSTTTTGGGTTTTSSGSTDTTAAASPVPSPTIPTEILTVNVAITGGSAKANSFKVTVKDNTANATIFSGSGSASTQYSFTQGHNYSVTETTTSAAKSYIVTLGTGCSGTINSATTCTITNSLTSGTPTLAPTSTSNTTTTVITTGASTTTTIVTVPPILSTGMQWGAYVGDGTSNLANFETLVGKKVNIQADFEGWDATFPSGFKTTVGSQGKTILIYWEPSFGYDTINNGSEDSYITQFATGAKSYGYPVILVPFDEMNLNEEAWGYGQNGNSAAKFVQAWQHIHDLFVAAGATNVKFGIAYNAVSIPDVTTNSFSSYYPGDAYVDYVGVDGFNFGTPWQTFGQIFDNAINQLESHGKPIYIFSTGSVPGTLKAAWITDALAVHIKTYSNIAGWIWFNQNGADGNWLVNSDVVSLAAFQAAIPQ